jgi:hypothetical protein
MLTLVSNFTSVRTHHFKANCTQCTEGYYCLQGSISPTQFDCANETAKNPANFYCPMGSGHPLVVPIRYFSLPEDIEFLYNRFSIEQCPRNKASISVNKYLL